MSGRRYTDRERAYLDAGLQANGLPFPQEPVQSAPQFGNLDDYDESHPAYAIIGASRVTSTGTSLFGSDFKHHGYVSITVKRATLHRGLSSDRTFGREQLIEVKLSEAQWASFVSTMNVGDGVKATLGYVTGEGHVPQIVPITNRREQAHGEMSDALSEAREAIVALRDAAPSKKLREQAEAALRKIDSSVPFVANRFAEFTETTIEHAKIEVDAWMTSAIQRAGLQALGAPIAPPIELAEPDVDPLTAADERMAVEDSMRYDD